MSRKVFTAGEVLAAADVNSFLMDQSVMSFAGTAARGSAIPSPVEGMVTYLEDTDDISVYNGSSYDSALGLVLVAKTDFTATGSIQFNNVFTSRYENYRIVFSNVTAGVSAAMSWNLSNGGVQVTTATYGDNRLFGQGATIGGQNFTSQVGARMMILGSTGPSSIVMDLFRPALATQTRSITIGNQADSNTAFLEMFNAFQTDATAFDGINFNYGSNISGTVRIYGYRNA
jgi:hypothetical protein